MSESGTLEVGALVFPKFAQFDVMGPLAVFAQLRDCRVRLFAADPAPVADESGVRVVPDVTLNGDAVLDVLVVPGGSGQELLMDDQPVLEWIAHHGSRAGHVLSVCTGALLVGAAGLLRGKRATTHWAFHELLPYFGADPVKERVVVDGSLVTTAGLSAGVDGALTLLSRLRGESVTRAAQLQLEYAPEPPFDGGTEERTPADVRDGVRARYAPLLERRRSTALRVTGSRP